MRKKYSLDFSIVRDTERLKAVQDILDQLPTDPSPTELEQMASYILYGKDEDGKNSIQRNETIDKDKRYKSYKTKDDKVQSLDEMMEVPGFDEQQLRSAYKRDSYTIPKPCINKPKYDKKTGEMIDPGDSDVPGMIEQWEIIDRWQRMLDIAQGRVQPQEGDTLVTDPYRIYQLKHNLIDIRKHQYYLKDSAKPTLHFQNISHPKPQFYDWCGDSFYWLPQDKWQERVDHSYTTRISKDIKDYETRETPNGIEVKWIVCEHNFNWENPKHIAAFITYYQDLKLQLWEKLDTYGRTLFWDFDRYRKLMNLSPLKSRMLDLRIQRTPYEDIISCVAEEFGIVFHANHLTTIFQNEIPKKMAIIAAKLRLEIETPESEKIECARCGRMLPANPLFFSRNNARKTKFARNCKECERKIRVEKGVVAEHDKREKMYKM